MLRAVRTALLAILLTASAARAEKRDYKELVRHVIRRHLMEVYACAQDKPGAEVTAEFTVGADGKVTKSTAHGSDADVASCVAGVIAKLEFPRPTSGTGVQVSYPFRFSDR